MKFGKNKFAVVLGAALTFGSVGQASADVYGLSYVDIDDLLITLTGFSGGSAGLYGFSVNQDAILNGSADLSDGSASCAGLFGGLNNCGAGAPRLSGLVQNAPLGAPVRGEGDYTKYGMGTEYSNAEAEIISAVLTGDAVTHVAAISESNLVTGTGAQANTNVTSNTLINITFTVEGTGGFSIAFNAILDVLSQVTGADIGFGIAQANSGVTVLLQKDGATLASWAPNGSGNVTSCGGGLVCSATDPLSLNNTTSSFGPANQVVGSGAFKLDVTGLNSGTYTLALAATTSTDLLRIPQETPVPGTLLLMGTGLLLGGRALRRNK